MNFSKKNINRMVGIISIVLIGLASLTHFINNSSNSIKVNSNSSQNYILSDSFELKNQIAQKLNIVKNKPRVNVVTQIGITSHHLPTAMDFIINMYGDIYSHSGPRNTFVIVGPDHFNKCSKPITTTSIPYLTPFGEISADKEIVNKLISGYANNEYSCLENEHSIKVQTIFIKYLYPNAKIVPIVISSSAKFTDVEKIVSLLSNYQDKITVICSTDFSHYRTLEVAKRLDNESLFMINNLIYNNLDINHVDSPLSVKLTILFAKKIGANSVNSVLANSFDFTNQNENTTGYIDAIFTK